jgi:hypothetical protein
MILLVGLTAPRPPSALLRTTVARPAVPVQGIIAAAMRCASLAEVEESLAWRDACSAAGLPLPIALVVPRDPEITRRIALEPLAPAALLFDDELEDGALPARILDVLRGSHAVAAAEAELMERWGHHLPPPDRDVLRWLVRWGAAGRRAKSAAAEVGMSASTLARWLGRGGLPTAGVLLRTARAAALRALEEAGVEPPDAAILCGWKTPRGATRFSRRNDVAG